MTADSCALLGGNPPIDKLKSTIFRPNSRDFPCHLHPSLSRLQWSCFFRGSLNRSISIGSRRRPRSRMPRSICSFTTSTAAVYISNRTRGYFSRKEAQSRATASIAPSSPLPMLIFPFPKTLQHCDSFIWPAQNHSGVCTWDHKNPTLPS